MDQFAFNPNATGLDLTNALYLAKLSKLAYEDNISEQDLLNEFGLSKYTPFNDKVTNTQAFIAVHDQFVVLAFRGTTVNCMEDWCTDLKTALVKSFNGLVHRGFNTALDSIWNGVYDTVCSTKGKDQKLWITGHSLGGALATLAADRFIEKDLYVDGLYTYGQPRAGDRDFVKSFNVKMHRSAFRFVNNGDVVAQVPFPPGYKHINAECFFDNKGELFTNNPKWNWWRSICEDAELRSLKITPCDYIMQRPGGIAAHNLDLYIQLLTNKLQTKQKANTFKDYINN